MKKKQVNKKLSLNKITIAGLDNDGMKGAYGGTITDPYTEPTYCCIRDITLTCTFMYKCLETLQQTCSPKCNLQTQLKTCDIYCQKSNAREACIV